MGGRDSATAPHRTKPASAAQKEKKNNYLNQQNNVKPDQSVIDQNRANDEAKANKAKDAKARKEMMEAAAKKKKK